NGMGGACAALISIVEFGNLINHPAWTIYPPLSSLSITGLHISKGHLVIIMLGLIIGSISFAGSMIAWGKLNGTIKDFSFKGQHIINLVLLAAAIGLSVLIMSKAGHFGVEANLSSNDLQTVIFNSDFPVLIFYG